MSARSWAYTHLTLAMCIAGSAVVAGKLMVSSMPVFLAAEAGLLASLAVQIPFTFMVRREPIPTDLAVHLYLVLQALFGVVLYRVFIFHGLQHTTATTGGLISSTTPLCIVLFSTIFLRERITRRTVAGAACVVMGLAAINLPPLMGAEASGTGSFMGNVLVLAAVVSESAFSVMSRAKRDHLSPLARTAMVSLYAALCLLPFAMHDAMHYDMATLNAEILVCIAYYGVFVSFLSYLLWFKGVAVIAAGTAASFTGLIPLSSMGIAWLVLNETITATHIVGLAFVGTGIAIACMRPAACSVTAKTAV